MRAGPFLRILLPSVPVDWLKLNPYGPQWILREVVTRYADQLGKYSAPRLHFEQTLRSKIDMKEIVDGSPAHNWQDILSTLVHDVKMQTAINNLEADPPNYDGKRYALLRAQLLERITRKDKYQGESLASHGVFLTHPFLSKANDSVLCVNAWMTGNWKANNGGRPTMCKLCGENFPRNFFFHCFECKLRKRPQHFYTKRHDMIVKLISTFARSHGASVPGGRFRGEPFLHAIFPNFKVRPPSKNSLSGVAEAGTMDARADWQFFATVTDKRHGVWSTREIRHFGDVCVVELGDGDRGGKDDYSPGIAAIRGGNEKAAKYKKSYSGFRFSRKASEKPLKKGEKEDEDVLHILDLDAHGNVGEYGMNTFKSIASALANQRAHLPCPLHKNSYAAILDYLKSCIMTSLESSLAELYYSLLGNPLDPPLCDPKSKKRKRGKDSQQCSQNSKPSTQDSRKGGSDSQQSSQSSQPSTQDSQDSQPRSPKQSRPLPPRPPQSSTSSGDSSVHRTGGVGLKQAFPTRNNDEAPVVFKLLDDSSSSDGEDEELPHSTQVTALSIEDFQYVEAQRSGSPLAAETVLAAGAHGSPTRPPMFDDYPNTRQAQVDFGEVQIDWIQCCRCRKWRAVAWWVDNASLTDTWSCELNGWDPSYASCSADEDEWSRRRGLCDSDPLGHDFGGGEEGDEPVTRDGTYSSSSLDEPTLALPTTPNTASQALPSTSNNDDTNKAATTNSTSSAISDLDRCRLANIARNEEMLRNLGLDRLRPEMQPTPCTSGRRKSRSGTDNPEPPPTSSRTTYNRARKSKNSLYDNSVYDLSPTSDAEVEEEVSEDGEDEAEEHQKPREKRRRRRRQADPPPSLTFQKEDDDDDDNDNVWKNDDLKHNPGIPSLDHPADTTDTTYNSPASYTYNPSKFNNDQRAFLQKLFVNYKAEISGRVNHAFIRESLAPHPHLFPSSFLDSLTGKELGEICRRLKLNPTSKRRTSREEAKVNKAAYKAACRKKWKIENSEKRRLLRKLWKSKNREKVHASKSASKRAKMRAKYADPNYVPRTPRKADQLFAADRDIPWNSTSKALFAALDEASKDKYLTLAKEVRETWKLKTEERKRAEATAIQRELDTADPDGFERMKRH